MKGLREKFYLETSKVRYFNLHLCVYSIDLFVFTGYFDSFIKLEDGKSVSGFVLCDPEVHRYGLPF